MTNHYFISYSSVDNKDFSLKLADGLSAEASAFSVWLDKQNLRNDRYGYDLVYEAIKTCKGLIFVMTEGSVARGSSCIYDLEIAQKYHKPIIPILADKNVELPFAIEYKRNTPVGEIIDFTGSFDAALFRLRKYLSPEQRIRELKWQFRRMGGKDVTDMTENEEMTNGLAELWKLVLQEQALIEDAMRRKENLQGKIDSRIASFLKHSRGDIYQEKPFEDDKHFPIRNQVFISYSHKDKRWFDSIQTMLQPLIREQKISFWNDKQIKAGQNWKEEISSALSLAKVAVLLVSPEFLASDFISKHELPKLLDASNQGELFILWIAVRDSLYKETEIEQYQAANDPQRPLASLSGPARDRAILKICERIKEAASGTPV
ncbi:MAG: toll/interleukin-1 receptor domain-containing protein [Chitinophagaceae bacterium]